MHLRFLQTLASDHPAYPFQAGQIIVVERLTPQFRAWVNDGRVQVLDRPLQDEEAAVLGEAPTVAVETRPRRRGAR